MARLAKLSEASENAHGTRRNVRSSRNSPERVQESSLSPSPSESFSSDKENQRSKGPTGRTKSKAMGPPQTPASEPQGRRQGLKRKLGERDSGLRSSQAIHEWNLMEISDLDKYDPGQSMEERRAVRRSYRDLSKELTESRAEYLAPGNEGLIDTLNRSNELFTTVKQTSEATLDSRLLVSTADLSMKRTTQLNLGDNTTGIDVDDFVSKCITFMRRGPTQSQGGDGPTATQRRRRVGDDSDEEGNAGEGYDEGDAFNWEYLGRQASCPYSIRPPVPGFLLGPLSVQKRARKATQRRERFQKKDPRDAVRPEELKAKDLEQAENSNLSAICTKIKALLHKVATEGEARAKAEIEANPSMPAEEMLAIMYKHGLSDTGTIPFFRFVVNPKSFGQTVENLFYVSFLIRDGHVKISEDQDGMPTLCPEAPRSPKEQQQLGVQKHQAVFHLDFETWENLIDVFQIKESIIPHRQPDPSAQVSASGWYA